MKINLSEYDYAEKQAKDIAEVDSRTIARCMDEKFFAALLEDLLNGMGLKNDGYKVGLQLRMAHRTLQRLAVVFCLDVLRGIAEQSYFDPRNEDAVLTAKKISKMMEDGDLPVGRFI